MKNRSDILKANRKLRAQVAFRRNGGLFGAVCRFLFAMPGA